MGIERVTELLERGVPGEHNGYQVFASVGGQPLCDLAGGSAQPGRPMTTDSMTLWFSSGKPITALAVVQLWEQGVIALDDRVTTYLPEFGNGKQDATIRHLLTHQGGFPFADDSLHPGPWEETVAQISASEAMWAPGTSAGYHGTSGWVILAEIVARVTGRSFEDYVQTHIFDPLKMSNTVLRVSADRIEELSPRLAHIQDNIPKTGEGIGLLEFTQYNSAQYLPYMSPGNTARGPARELGALMSALANGGAPVLSPAATEAMVAGHRLGVTDIVYAMNADAAHPQWGFAPPWALGLSKSANLDFGQRLSSRAVGSSGAFSSVSIADPSTGFACAVVMTGLLPLGANARRLGEVVNALHDAAFQ
jgi:CubicO group peptidase (beta-lactamase class C family)